MNVTVSLFLPIILCVVIFVGFSWLWLAARKAVAKAKADGKVIDLICKTCGTKGPDTRQPASWQEYWNGGWTCANCLTTVDRYGIAIPGISGRPASKPVSPWLGLAVKYRFVYMAVFWGFVMWLLLTAGPVMWDFVQGRGFDGGRLMLGLAVWAGAGCLFGFWMWLTQRKRGDQKKADDTSKHF